LRKNAIDELLQLQSSLVQLVVDTLLLLSCAEDIVGDIERDENREAEHIAFRRGASSRSHLLVDIGGEFRDVSLVETAPDGIPLSGDFDGDDTHWFRLTD